MERRGHPEPEGVLGEVPGQIFLVENEADVDALAPALQKVHEFQGPWGEVRVLARTQARLLAKPKKD